MSGFFSVQHIKRTTTKCTEGFVHICHTKAKNNNKESSQERKIPKSHNNKKQQTTTKSTIILNIKNHLFRFFFSLLSFCFLCRCFLCRCLPSVTNQRRKIVNKEAHEHKNSCALTFCKQKNEKQQQNQTSKSSLNIVCE